MGFQRDDALSGKQWLAVLTGLFTIWTSAAQAGELSLPNPILTPGAIDPSATLGVVCNGTTRTRRHVTTAMQAKVLGAYNIPDAESPFYEIDHLIPLAIGGANVVENLWPQPWAEAVQKDALEVELQRRVCHGLISQTEAQNEIADDWVATYARYVGGALISVPDSSAPTPSASTSTRSGFETHKTTFSWVRHWVFGVE